MSNKIAFDNYSDGNIAIKLKAGKHTVRLFKEGPVKVYDEATATFVERNRMTLVNDEGHEWTAWQKPDLVKVARAMEITLDQLLSSFKKDGSPIASRTDYFEITLSERTSKTGTVYVNIS